MFGLENGRIIIQKFINDDSYLLVCLLLLILWNYYLLLQSKQPFLSFSCLPSSIRVGRTPCRDQMFPSGAKNHCFCLKKKSKLLQGKATQMKKMSYSVIETKKILQCLLSKIHHSRSLAPLSLSESESQLVWYCHSWALAD